MNREIVEFPCDWPIKVFGPATDDFELAVVTVIRRHVDDLRENAVHRRLSREGKYQAVTVTVQAHSRVQLEALYAELRALPELIMVL